MHTDLIKYLDFEFHHDTFSYKIYFFALKDFFMVDLPLPGNFTSFLTLAVGFFEELPLGFLITEGEGLAFLAGVLALAGVFLGRGLAFPRGAAGTLGAGLDPLCFIDTAFPGDLAGVFFCNLEEQKSKGSQHRRHSHYQDNQMLCLKRNSRGRSHYVKNTNVT